MLSYQKKGIQIKGSPAQIEHIFKKMLIYDYFDNIYAVFEVSV